MAPILGIYASQISGHLFAPSGAYDSISTVNGTGSSGTISFTSIPSTYKHLQVRFLSRSDSAGLNQVFVQFNSDTGSNYSQHLLLGSGSVESSGTANASRMSVSLQGGASTAANIYGACVVDILDYADTNKNKTTRGLGGADANGSGYVWYSSGNWRNTNAITSIQIIAENGNFTTASQFALYGIKGA
jgi:hypothetical protein